MEYINYYWGMNFIWWIAWLIMIFWIFAIPYDIPGQRQKKATRLEMLKKRFALGEISVEEFLEKKKLV